MKKLVVRWLEVVTTAAFVVIVLWCTIIGFASFTSVGLSAVVGAVVGLLLGLIIAVVSTGIVYLLLSINEHLAEIRRASGPAA